MNSYITECFIYGNPPFAFFYKLKNNKIKGIDCQLIRPNICKVLQKNKTYQCKMYKNIFYIDNMKFKIVSIRSA